MSIFRQKVALYLLLIISSLFVIPPTGYCEESQNNQLAIQIYGGPDGIFYKIKSNSYKHPKISGLIQDLRNFMKDNGKESSVIILVDENISFSIILNIRKILWKIGFLKLSFFIYNENTQKMLEFKFGDQTVNFLKSATIRSGS